ncbi:unnamed protein product [Lota lota]
MGPKLDLSGLTELEAEHVLQVVQRDMRLRKKEEQRLSDLRRELEEEDGRCLLLSRQTRFNQLCCIRCCSPFNFLLNPRRRCGDCLLNVCRTCRAYRKPDRAWLCSTCQKRRLLKTQSLEWFYVNVKCRFKRFGSAKVLKTLYRKHLAERGTVAELTEGSIYEDSVYTEGSVCESDTALCRQSEEHGEADTLTVAKRVAGDAIDEAISKAEFHTDNQAKQNEALYLREHRGELIEELAKTIVQKIISRRKAVAEMKPGFDQECPPDSSQDSLARQAKIWRSQSAFSLLDNNSPELNPPMGLKNEGGGSAMSAWQSVDRLLDNSMLKSPDGNWITLQSGQLSRPSLLTRRKSLVFSALEQESGLVSAYSAMASDPETPPEYCSSWGAVLQDLHKKLTDGGLDIPDLEGDPQTPSRLVGRRSSVDGEGLSKHRRPSLAFMKRQLPLEIRRPSSSRRTSVINLNFNPEGTAEGESSGGEELKDSGRVRRSRRRRRSKTEKGLSSLPMEVLSCAPVEREQENKERWLQTGQGEETEICKDPTTTINETRVSKYEILRYELGLDNSEEKQVFLARNWRQAETKSDTSEHEEVGLDRIMSERTMREERDSDLYKVDTEKAVLSKEAVGEHGGYASQEKDHSETVERQGDRTTLGLICSSEGDLSHEMRTGGDSTAGGSEEQWVIASGSQAGDINPEDQTSILSPEEIQNRYSAVSLRSLTTEMLKVLNATEALLHGVGGAKDPAPPQLLLSLDTDPLRLDQQFSRLEENVYVAAGTVFSLESELGGLEECARAVSGDTPDGELSFLEEQVASAAAKVHQSELQVSNISARIAALKSAGLKVDSQSRITQARTIPTMPNDVPSSRQLRRRLPATPVEGKCERHSAILQENGRLCEPT